MRWGGGRPDGPKLVMKGKSFRCTINDLQQISLGGGKENVSFKSGFGSVLKFQQLVSSLRLCAFVVKNTCFLSRNGPIWSGRAPPPSPPSRPSRDQLPASRIPAPNDPSLEPRALPRPTIAKRLDCGAFPAVGTNITAPRLPSRNEQPATSLTLCVKNAGFFPFCR